MRHAESWILRNPDGGFGGGGSEADVQTPDGASIASDGGADYGGGDGFGGDAAVGTEPANDNMWGSEEPEAQPAQPAQAPGGYPDDHWAREYGIGSEAELRERLRGSEALEGRAQYLEKLVDKLSTARQMREEEARERADWSAPAKPEIDLAAIGQLMRVNPTEGYAKLFDHILQAKPELLEGRFGKVLDERLRPVEEARGREALNAGYQALLSKHPEAKPGTPQYEATARWMEQNPWHGALALPRPRITAQLRAAFPEVANYLGMLDRSTQGLNLSELAFYAANYPILAAQLAGANKRATLTSQRAVSARPGPARSQAPSDSNNIEAMVQHDIAEAQRHGAPLDAATIADLRFMYQRMMRRKR